MEGVMKLRIAIITLLSVAVLFACTITVHYLNEGTYANPVDIVVGFSYYGTIDEWGASYYRFSVAGGNYNVALTNLRSDLSWEIFDTFDDSSVAFRDFFFDDSDEVIDVALAAGTYIIEVLEYDHVDGTFTLTVTELP
jgi:hypothetical protein